MDEDAFKEAIESILAAYSQFLTLNETSEALLRLVKQFTGECRHAEAVFWNPHNRVVQCHRCGEVFVPISEAKKFVTEEEAR